MSRRCLPGCLACLQCSPTGKARAEAHTCEDKSKATGGCTLAEVYAVPDTKLHMEDSALDQSAFDAQEPRCLLLHIACYIVLIAHRAVTYTRITPSAHRGKCFTLERPLLTQSHRLFPSILMQQCSEQVGMYVRGERP